MECVTVILHGQKRAYNPKTHKTELEPIVKVWLNHDNDLVDLTITSRPPDQQGKNATTRSEIVHTTKKHPFLTIERGFLPVAHVKVGMHIQQADGHVGVITKWVSVPGARTMYNLEVANDHTFVVGQGQWVVHNCNIVEQLKSAGIETDSANHFLEMHTKRAAGVTVDDIKSILADGQTVFDNVEKNLVAVHDIPGKGLYRIAYDTNARLLSIAGKANGAGDILGNVRRFQSTLFHPELPSGWVNPFR